MKNLFDIAREGARAVAQQWQESNSADVDFAGAEVQPLDAGRGWVIFQTLTFGGQRGELTVEYTATSSREFSFRAHSGGPVVVVRHDLPAQRAARLAGLSARCCPSMKAMYVLGCAQRGVDPATVPGSVHATLEGWA